MLVEQNALRELMAAEYPNGPNLLNLLTKLAAEATHDFVMPRLQMYDTYRTRLRISQEVTGIAIEGLAETVEALEHSTLDEVRLIHLHATPADCLVFADQDLTQVLGILFLRMKNSSKQH